MIIRAKRDKQFTVLANATLEDSRLSFKARGILAYVLSKPDGWTVNVRHLMQCGPDGRDAIQTGLQELERTGYLVRSRHRKPDGTFEWQSRIYDSPQTENPVVENPQDSKEPPEETTTGKPGTMSGLSVYGKPGHIVNTEIENIATNTTDVVLVAQPAAIAAQINAALLAINTAKNKASAVGDLHVLCFGFEPSDWARLGALVKRYGAPEVARQFVLLVGRPPTDPTAYVQEVLGERRKAMATDRRTKGKSAGVLGEGPKPSSTATANASTGNAGATAPFVETDGGGEDIYL